MFEIKKDFTGRRYIESSVNGNKYEIKKSDDMWHIIKVYPYMRTEASYVIGDDLMYTCETFPTVIHACKWMRENADKLL